MKVYKVKYYFDGKGECTVIADSPEEAIQKFEEGNWEDEKEQGCNYEIDRDTIQEVN